MDTKFYNSLIEGDFGNGLPLCQGLVEGDFWVRTLGCYNIYRGCGHIDDIDYEHIVAVTTAKGTLTLPASINHQADTDYFYAVRCASGTGQQEKGTMAVVKLSLDGQGDQRLVRANCVKNLYAQPISGGKIRVSWWYWPIGQQALPDHFAVYGDGGSGTVDYINELAQIEYTDRYFYSYVSTVGQDRKAYRYSVRSVTADGIDDGNSEIAQAVVDLTGPDGIAAVACGNML